MVVEPLGIVRGTLEGQQAHVLGQGFVQRARALSLEREPHADQEKRGPTRNRRGADDAGTPGDGRLA